MSSQITESDWDVIVVGAGPAGSSGALLLGRCKRSVLVFDDGHPRNEASRASHGFFTRDGASPQLLRDLGRQQLERYGVNVVEATVSAVERDEQGFVVTAGGERHHGRALLLATGVVDELPEVDGLPDLYGTSVFHCPFCDGWESRDERIAAYARGPGAVEFATKLTSWSDDVTLCTDGWTDLTAADRRLLDAFAVEVRTEPIARVRGRNGQLEHVVFRDGGRLERDVLFFKTASRQRSSLATMLGCELDENGMIRCDERQRTSVGRLHVAGDASHELNLITIAAAEGVRAAVAIHNELHEMDAAARLAALDRRSR